MKKIALITIYHVPNYGSVLQAYATQIMLEEHNIECDVINYRYPNEWHFANGMRRPNMNISKTILKRILAPVFRIAGIHCNLRLVLDKFKKRNFKFTCKFNNYDQLCEYDWSQYDAVAVGSDQVWNYRFTLSDKTFMLAFVPDKVKKLSISSSFACKSIPESFRSKYEKYLLRFQALSVREQNGINILTQELGAADCKLLLDPTLLLSASQWKSRIKPTAKYRNRKYILLYGLYYAFEPRPYIYELIKSLKVEYGCEVIALSGYAPVEQTDGLIMADRSDASINEFIELFDNAFIVVTSSFHGTAFAINFGRPLVSVVPSEEDDRQSSLLRMLGLESCITPIGTLLSNINPFYPVEPAQKQLYEIRQDNINWLINNI